MTKLPPTIHALPFNLLTDSLLGTNLIEASAGTGKTYTITGLFLRLILEKHLSVEQILVVTFTQAATSELKERIRGRLHQAIDAFSSNGSEDDKFLDALVKKYDDDDPESKHIKHESLKTAIRDFDEAAIYTIHGFCQRMLHDHAFESGSLFDTELVTEQETLKQEIVEDFWRKNLYPASPLFVNYVIDEKKLSPHVFADIIGNKISQPYLKIIPEIDTDDVQDSSPREKAFQDAFDSVSKAWETAKDEVEEILLTDKGLNRTSYSTKSIPNWIHSMNEYLNLGHKNPLVFKEFERFTSGNINTSIKKNHIPPKHEFFDLCEDLKNKHLKLICIFEKKILVLKTELFRYVKEELFKRKQIQNTQSFDDLLLNLHNALEGKSGKPLAENIRKRFKAALIDEFQDTDPVQYAIFKKIFIHNSSENTNCLFLIGDPKQAIYGFRGADVFAYMDAADHAESRYTLIRNWRSDPALIQAVNTVFQNTHPAFIYDEIPFEPANAPEEKLNDSAESESSPLRLWFVDATKETGTENKVINKPRARELIVDAVASEISRLLKDKEKILINKRPLREEDIAVLVRKNREAQMIQDALMKLNIPSVLFSTLNLFDTYEALEMERILSAIVQPDNEIFIRTALATKIMGMTGEELDALSDNESDWENRIIRFRIYHDIWNRHGFIRMFKQFMTQEKVLPRIMRLPDGERRNTNLLHLAEVLQQASVKRKLSMAWLVKWLAEQRDAKQARLEAYQLRLEKDENAVKLVTIHKSKGLEYPIVFCPFNWEGSKIDPRNAKSKEAVLFHDEKENRRATFDIGSPDMAENKKIAEKEMLAENLRLIYVALTRAKHRCYLIWGRFNKAETSAPAYLFHYPNPPAGKEILSELSNKVKGLTNEKMLAELETKTRPAIHLSEIPSEPGEKYSPCSDNIQELTYRKFSGNIDRGFSISSFSSMTSDRYNNRGELPDHDEESEFRSQEPEDTLSPLPSTTQDILSFPKGKRAGDFFHEIFECLDFTEKNPSIIKKLAEEKLNAYHYEPTWQETICEMLRKILSSPLIPGQKNFTLSRIPNKDRLNELEFYFPLNPISPGTLKSLFQKYVDSDGVSGYPEQIGNLNFLPSQGFMKGFIDMVFQFEERFYLIDWKSNFLGNRVQAYHQDALSAVMKEKYYFLQYHIYTLALHQYLKQRKPDYHYETDFGGVFYIFLRGVDPGVGEDFGIFRDKPSYALIDAFASMAIK